MQLQLVLVAHLVLTIQMVVVVVILFLILLHLLVEEVEEQMVLKQDQPEVLEAALVRTLP
jgi:hypothetical protein